MVGSTYRWWVVSTAAVSLLLSACSSVTSRFSAQDDPTSVDGLVYTLPATELEIAVTYELVGCAPAKLKLVDLQVTSQVIRDPGGPRFEIDVDKLYGFSTSVNPAKFQFADGLLKSVEFKPQSELAAFLKQVVATSTQLRTNLNVAQTRLLDGLVGSAKCEPAAEENLQRLGVLSKTIAELRKAIDAQNSAFSAAPTLENEEQLGRLEARLAAVGGAATLHRNQTLLRATTAQLLVTRTAMTGTIDPDVTALADWFDPNEPVELKQLAQLHYEASADEDTRVAAPHGQSADGVFYRLPVRADLVITHPMSDRTFRSNDLELLQLGTIGFLEIKNRAFQKRGISIVFNDKGQLTSFEAVSTAVARDIAAVPTDALSERATAEMAALQREIDLLKKQKELIDAQEALDDVPSGSQ
jgi:hypothetical protein